MACEGNALSDERIGEALIQVVIEDQLREVDEDVPALTPLAAQNEQELKVVNQLASMVRYIGDRMQHEREFNDAIDSMAQVSDSKWDKFMQVVEKVFIDGITWERIVLLIYVAGKLAVKMVRAHLPQSVRDILRWTVDYFKNYLLDWIQQHGGWINSFSELAAASMQRISTMSSHSYSLILGFVAGLCLGGFVVWKMTK